MKSILSSRAALVATVILIGSLTLPAQDWPQWRGPGRDGKISGFIAPEKWPAELTQKWTLTVGKGDGSPLLVADRLYCFTRQDANEVVLCLNPADGKTIWQDRYPANLDASGPSAKHSGPWSTPTIADGKLCALGLGGILSCYDAAGGALRWRKQSDEDYLGIPFKCESAWSPIVVDGLVIVLAGNEGGAIMAFELGSGQFKWKSDSDGVARSSPVIMTAGGVKQLVAFTAKSLTGLALADGKLLWRMDYEASQGNNTTPIVDGEILILTGQSMGLSAVKVEAKDGKFTVTEQWKNDQLSARFTTPVLKDGLLYGYANALYCASAQNGETIWKDSVKRGNSAALLDGGAVVWAMTHNGELAALKPGSKELVELARYKVASTEVWAHPVIAGKRFFIKDDTSLSLWMME